MTELREINVQPQAKLSLQRIFKLVRSGIKHRLLRSSLTMSVILLAVAFFMSTLSENVIISKIAQGVDQEIIEERSSTSFLNHLYLQPNTIKLSQKIALLQGNDESIAEFIAVIKWDKQRFNKLVEQCYIEQTYLDFFKHMKINQRKMLIGKLKGPAIFDMLTDDASLQLFRKKLEPLRSLKLPGEETDFIQFLNQFHSYSEELAACQKDWNKAIAAFTTESLALSKGTEIEIWLCTANDQEFEQWCSLIKKHNFLTPRAALDKIRNDMKLLKIQNDVNSILLSPKTTVLWNKTFRKKDNLETKYTKLNDERALKVINEVQSDHTYTTEELAALQKRIAYNNNLAYLQVQLSTKTEQKSGSLLSGKQTFLLIISFFVCMVGIANAMLMAITERFREIATMKCLGATDGFILIQFMMEAAIQGVAGGIFGVVVGFILCMVKTTVAYGGYPFYYFPFIALVICGIASLLIGIVLAIIASLYPSWAASRMAPMEAMRVE